MIGPAPNDQPITVLGDKAWIGVNMRLDPAQLPPGYASEAVNMRFRHGVPETRLGTMVLPWVNKCDLVAATFGAWGTIYGQGTFSDPATHFDYTIIAADGLVYQTTENNCPALLTLPSGVTIDTPVTFTQAFDKLIMWRGPGLPPLILSSIFLGFENITQTPLSDPNNPQNQGTDNIPNASRAIFFQNRLLIPHGDDEIAASDIGDITRYSPVFADFRINQGSTDKIVGLVKFSDNTLIIFKERSIYQVSNIYGDLGTITLDLITAQYGCVAAESIVQTGSDVWFLSQLGVMSLRQTDLNKVQATALPISEPLQPLFERINWRYASGACGALWDSKYYIALPVDGAYVRRESLLAYGTPIGLSHPVTLYVTIGRQYEYVEGGVGGTLVNGSQTITQSAIFTARASTITISFPGFNSFTGAIYPLYQGVNTVVAVYDFLNQAWCGYDQAMGIEPVKWFLAKKGGKDRLFYINKDGWLILYEEDYVDQLTQPYAIIAASGVDAGDTIRINSGTTVTAAISVTDGATSWGITGTGDNLFDIEQLWGSVAATVNGYGFGGAYGSAPTQWSAPNCFVGLVYDATLVGVSVFGGPFSGLRVTSLNGKVPVITTTGGWSTITYYNQQQIDSYMITRGYSTDSRELLNVQTADIDIQTWSPSLTVQTLTPGVAEEKSIVSAITRSRVKYSEPANKADWDATNVNDDFRTAYREDYSIIIPTAGIYIGQNGIAMDYHQEARVTFNCFPTVARTVQLKLRNTSGRMRIVGLRCNNVQKASTVGIYV